jgi:hypothetical protein
MEHLECSVYGAYDNVQGGYTFTEMFDYDDDEIDLELKFGIEGDRMTTEQYGIDRPAMNSVNIDDDEELWDTIIPR